MLDSRYDPLSMYPTDGGIDGGIDGPLGLCCESDRLDIFELLLTDNRVDVTRDNYAIIPYVRQYKAHKILEYLGTYPLTRDMM